MKKLLSTTWGTSLFFFCSPIVYCSILSAFFWIITPSVSFLKIAYTCYLWFGAPLSIAAVVNLLIPHMEAKVGGLSCGFYYGGAILAGSSLIYERWVCFLVSFLICYIVYLYMTRELKPEFKDVCK
jgi:hypothetical protein